MQQAKHNPALELDLEAMGFRPAAASLDHVVLVNGKYIMDGSDAYRHPLLRATLYVSRTNPGEWFLGLDAMPVIFRGDSEPLLLDTVFNLMPVGAA
jgi:hypothetical protein